ncbi:MAG: T9SS type A sorting domain-containing protein, partial [Flavobacterium sp.]|nr:T9SS type A sorting domain-containing protein [Flavobacterium sp.]
MKNTLLFKCTTLFATPSNKINTTRFNGILALFIMVMGMGVSWGQNTSKFNDGYLSVFKVTSGANLTNTATAVVIEEYVPTGASQSSSNYSFAFPATSGPAANQVCISGTATSAGQLTRSENGRYLAVPGYFAALGAANTTFTTNGTVRLLNGSGTIGSGIQATTLWLSGNNELRGAATDDGTNYWLTGGKIGIQHTNTPGTVTTVSTTVTNTRNIQIYNGQLYFSTASSTQGVWQLGSGKPTTASTTATNLIVATGSNCFSVSPDGLTIYAFSSANQISRFTYSGTYSSNSYSGGTWSAASSGFTCTAASAIAVDWSGYSFSTSANGAKVFACNSTILVTANDNGTGFMTTTTLTTISGNNAFRGLAFSPIKQTISKGANTPATGNITKGSSNTVLFQMNLSADEGNSTVKKVVLATSGTAVLGTDISNFRILNDANNDGVADTSEIAAGFTTIGTISGSNIIFSGLSLSSYIAQGSSKNFLIIGDVSASATTTRTFTPSIASNNTINSIAYTSNLTNAGGSLVTMGTSTNAPTGNTLTIVAPSTTNVSLGTTGRPSSANLGTGSGKLIYGFSLTPSGGSVNFTALNITTAGTATTSDISTFDLYLDADNSGTINIGDVLVKTVSTLANPLAFSSFTNAQTGLADGTTYRYLVQATVAGSPTNGRTITLSIAATSDITTNVTGSVSNTPAGNTMYVGNPSSATDNTGTPSASNVTKAATDFVVFGFQLTPTGLVDFTALNINTAGTATSSDISNFRLYKDANSNGVYDNGTDVLVQTVSTLSSTLSFSSLAQTGLTAATKYLVIANIASGATTGRTFTASIAANGDITLASGSNTGTAEGNQMTVDAGTFGDFRSNGTGGGVWSSTSTWQTYSATGTWVAASVAPTSTTYVTKDVTILSGDQVTVTGTSNYCKNLMVQGSGGKLFSNQFATTFINVYGDITCNGTIGNGSTYDAIGFDVEGSTCLISGSGTFDAARIAKNSITSPAATTTTLTFDMNVNLRYGGTGSGSQSSNNTALYNNVAGSIFNIVINSSRTLTCIGDGTETAASAISIDGTDGAAATERGGSLTVNGTLDIQYNGTPSGGTPTYGLYLTTNNATSAVSVSIGATGIINTPRIVCSASGVAGHTFSIASGGTLNITNEPTSFVTPSNTNNTFNFDANSNINYNRAGVQTIYTFGSSVYQGNITLSGSGVKSVPSTGILNLNGTLTTAGLLTLKSNASGTASIGSLTTGTITGNVTVERYIPAKRAWRALTAPVNTTNSIFANWQENGANSGAGNGVNGFDIWMPGGSNGLTAGGSSNSLLEYNSANNNWTGITATNGSNSMMNGNKNKPFMAFVTGPYGSGNISSNSAAAATLRATGSLFTGNQTYTTTADKYTFIGNPYASPLNLKAMLDDSANNAFDNTIWIWQAIGAGNVGVYNTFDPAGAGAYANDTNTIVASTEIQSGQAFFVKSSAADTFTIKESHKGITNNGASIIFRDAAPAQLLRVGLYKQENNEWSGRDGAMTVILPDANANQTPNKMANGTENVAFVKNGSLFASNHHLPLVASDVLNVRVWRTTAGANYKLKINTEDFVATNLSATLEDLFTNSRTPLNLEGAAVEYPFTVTTDALSTGDRFRIVFQNAVLGTNNPTATGFSIVPNPVTGDTFQVNLGTLATGIYTYYIYNAIGQEVEKGTLNNATQNTNYEVKMSNAATGIYIMKIK